MTEAELRALADRREIEELLHRYAWMVDRREWALMDLVFAPGATIDYESTGVIKGEYRATLAWLDRALAPWPINLHFISNVQLDLSGNEGRSHCYFQAPMGRARADGTQEVITNAGYYEDRLVRTPRGWRIAERVCRQTVQIGSLPPGYAIPR
ncbi:MAG: nuclear transport factor 2 family protein [Deltaproteobacteria bacterium]|nr:nuclear transport factor 2 family protein [Deltaproteobacteria bacterium]